MEPSTYQQAVFDHFGKRAGHAAVMSVAGSGKTWTALRAIGQISRQYDVLLAAFNVDIRNDFEAKGKELGYRHVRYVNYNSFGWSICLKELRERPILDKDKSERTLEAIMQPRSDADQRRFRTIRGGVTRLVSLFKSYALMSVAEADAAYDGIVERQQIEEPGDKMFRELVLATFDRSIRNTSVMDFDDQKYMPVHLGLQIPKFDQVVLDEFQDTCEIEMRLLGAACGGQFCGIGDPDQCIYGFKGASPEFFDRYVRDWKAKVLPLSICYRCPTSVIEEAKKIVPRIEAAPGAIAGSVDTISKMQFWSLVRPGDFVLCRTTEPLIRECLKFVREGINARVRGRDVTDRLIALIDRISGGDYQLAVHAFISRLFEYQVERTAMLERTRRESEIERHQDQCSTTHALCENCQTVGDAVRRLESITVNDKERHTGVDLMTIHKSKGLQAKRVFVLRPDLLPHPRSGDLAEEQRLKYVAITRAEEELRWVLKSPGEK